MMPDHCFRCHISFTSDSFQFPATAAAAAAAGQKSLQKVIYFPRSGGRDIVWEKMKKASWLLSRLVTILQRHAMLIDFSRVFSIPLCLDTNPSKGKF
jgi:hypothetical protein